MGVVLGLSVWLIVLAPAFAGEPERDPLRFAAIGDMPYGGALDRARFVALIAAINLEGVEFTVHVGDIKSGATRCSDESFDRIVSLFARFSRPLVYTPGDNEWTDCHRETAGRHDPLERLTRLREVFFAAPFQFGAPGSQWAVQADDPAHDAYVENQRWEQEGVVFATLHVVGSFDNARRDADEFVARRAAALDWVDAAFVRARAIEARAVVLFFHGDAFYRTDRARNEAFTGFLDAVAVEAMEFGGPVLLVHGDSHAFTLDKPLKSADGTPLANVARLQVWGPGAMRAVVVSVEDAGDGRAQFRFDVLGAPQGAQGGTPVRWSAARFGFPSLLP
jgi:hypothetical protein